MARRVSAEQFEAEVLESPVPVLVDFYSDSCVPCKRLAPRLAKLEPEFEGRVAFVKVNVAFDLELAQRYGIMASPTLVLLKDGKELARHQGLLAVDDVRALVEQAL